MLFNVPESVKLLFVCLLVFGVTVAPVSAETVLKVNDETMSKQEFEKIKQQRMQQMQRRMQQLPENRREMMEKRLQQQLQQQLVQELALMDAAHKSDVEVSDQELEKFLDEQLGEMDRQQALSRMGITEQQLRSRARDNLLAKKYLDNQVGDINVNESEIRSYFDENKDEFSQSKQVNARHILIKDEDKSGEEARSKAKEVRKKLEEGGNFCDLASKYSEGPTASRCGKLGFFTRSQMDKSFSKAAFSMDTGEISDPVKSNFGFHVIEKLDERDAKDPNFEEVKPEIRERLKARKRSQKIQEHVQKLVESATVERNFPGNAGGASRGGQPMAPRPGGGREQGR